MILSMAIEKRGKPSPLATMCNPPSANSAGTTSAIPWPVGIKSLGMFKHEVADPCADEQGEDSEKNGKYRVSTHAVKTVKGTGSRRHEGYGGFARQTISAA